MSASPKISLSEPLGVSSGGEAVEHPAKNQEIFTRLKSDVGSGDPVRYTQALSEITRFCSERRAYYALAKPEIAEVLSIGVQVYQQWKISAHPIVGALASSLHTFARTLLPFLSEFNDCPHLHESLNTCYRYLFDRPDTVFVPHPMSAHTRAMAPPSANVKFSTRPTLVPVSLTSAARSPFDRGATPQLPAAHSPGRSSPSMSMFPGHSGVPTLMYSELGEAERGLPALPASSPVALAPKGVSPRNSIIPTAQSGPDLEMSWEDWEALEDDDKGAPPLRETMEAAPIALDLRTQSKPEFQEPSVQEATSSAAPPEIGEQSIAPVIEVTLQEPKVEPPVAMEGNTTSTVLNAGDQVASTDEPTNSPDNAQSHIPFNTTPMVTDWGARGSSNIQTAVSVGTSLSDVAPVGMELDVSELAIPLETQNKDSAADSTMAAPEGDGADPSEAFFTVPPPLQTDGSPIDRLSSPQGRKDGMEVHEDSEISTILGPTFSVTVPEVAGEESEDTSIPEGETRNSDLAPQVGTPQLDKVSLSTSLPGIFAPESLKSEVSDSAPTGESKDDIDTFRELLIPIVGEIHPNTDVAQLRDQVSADDLTQIAKLGPAVLAELRATQAAELDNGSHSASVRSPKQLMDSGVPEASSSTTLPPAQSMLPSPSWSVHDVEASLLQSDYESSPDVTSTLMASSAGAQRMQQIDLDDHHPNDPVLDVTQAAQRKSPNPEPVVGPEPVIPRSVVQVLCTLEGRDKLASQSATFELSQEFAGRVERWSNRHSSFSPTEEYLSVTLRCFPKSQANGKLESEPPEDKWPIQNSLFLTLNGEENPYYLPLTTLCLVSQPICISPLCRAGSNSIRLLQLLDHSDLMFSVQVEKPSSLEMNTYKDMSVNTLSPGLDTLYR